MHPPVVYVYVLHHAPSSIPRIKVCAGSYAQSKAQLYHSQRISRLTIGVYFERYTYRVMALAALVEEIRR